MVHGTSSEHLLWPMIRYAQQSGNDAICKAIILTHLGEPNCPDLMQVVKENEGIASSPRDVGLHAQTVVKLLSLRQREGKDMTLAMLVKEWRSTGSSVPQLYVKLVYSKGYVALHNRMLNHLPRFLCFADPSVKDNLPGKDDLTAEDCERIIVSLLLEKVFATNPIWNAYK